MLDNPDPLRENVNSYEAENTQPNLLYLVNLVIIVNELVRRKHANEQLIVLKKLFDTWKNKNYKRSNGLFNTFVYCGGTDLSIKNNRASDDKTVQFSNTELLEQCKTTETGDNVLKNMEEIVLDIICKHKTQIISVDEFKFSFRIFENFFKHAEITFIDLKGVDGINVFFNELRRRNVMSLKPFHNVLFNLWQLYGCPKNHNIMIKHNNVFIRLFTLMLNTEDNVKYFIPVLVTDKGFRTVIINSKIPMVTAKSNILNVSSQSQVCLKKCIPVLNSDSEEASKVSELGIKKQLGTTNTYRARNVIEPLEEEAIHSASRLAAQSCQLIAEEIPYRLSIRVPQWSTQDVLKWLKLIGFSEFSNNLLTFLIDGDLLLQLTEDDLENDIGIHNGITKKRIMRELYLLKLSADYSSIDTIDLNSFLKSISFEYSVYTYSMLKAGVNKDSMRSLTDDQLKNDCGILNSIHRSCIIAAIKEMPVCVENDDRPFDMCISYRQSIGSWLASLLVVYLRKLGYKVFIDGIRSDDANSRQSVLQTIKQSKNFIIVLTPGSLDKHLKGSFDGGVKTLDLISEEVAVAEQGQCNIIPVLGDHFSWPSPALLPDDLKNLSNYNSISWVHEYQEACVNKLITFLDQ